MALNKLCGYSGCRELVGYGVQYCDKHKEIVEQEHKQSYKEYKARRTDKREEAFYNSKAWEQVRELAKGKTNYMDVLEYYTTGEVNRIVQGETVHHVVCLKDEGGWEHKLDINNLIYLTYASHSIVHAKYDKSKKDKEEMQKLLFSLLERYKKEFE